MLEAIDGYKTYIGLAFGALALVAHAAGINVPGLNVDDSAILTNLWLVFMAAAGRSALAKVASPQEIAALLKMLSDALANVPRHAPPAQRGS